MCIYKWTYHQIGARYLMIFTKLSFLACAFLAGSLSFAHAETKVAPYNVLFIALDDLNDWVGAFGGAPLEQSATPRMDKFAANGSVVFQQANCAFPLCNPSRSALLSGFMPNRSGVYSNPQNMLDSELVRTHLTLPEYFSKHGYDTLSMGKVFHQQPGDPGHWAFDKWVQSKNPSGGRANKDRMTSRNKNLIDGQPAPFEPITEKGEEDGVGEGNEFSWGPTMGPKEETKDWQTAVWAAAQFTKMDNRPFFLAVGFSKPHLPWFVPQEYFDRHPLDTIKIPKFQLDDLDDIRTPQGQLKYSPSADFKFVQKDSNLFKSAVRGYLAATSYADDCVGHVLDALEKSPYRDNTIVVIWGDHGWHLGEKLRFRKSTLWAESTRLPLIIRVPGKNSQQNCPRLVNLVDLYPTLIELCGLPNNPEIDGRSFASLLRNPMAEWPYPSISVCGRGNASIRDERWYFIRYNDDTEEFYDMERDPMQWTNLVTSKDPEVRTQMKRLASYFPTSFASGLVANKKGKHGGGDGEDGKSSAPDPTIKSTRAAANLK